MSGPDVLSGIVGDWRGNKSVYLPDQAPDESRATAVVTRVVSDKFTQIDYTWAFAGSDQAGKMLVGYQAATDRVTAVWIDSWHMGDTFMVCSGQIDAHGALDLLGSYAVEGGPEWGWRIVIGSKHNAWRMSMYNIMPDGQEVLGVDATFTRSG